MPDASINLLSLAYVAPKGLSLDVPLPSYDLGPGLLTELRNGLSDKKVFKLMSKQDLLAVGAAQRAVGLSGLLKESLLHETGIYLAVGSVAFEREPLQALYENSVSAGKTDYLKFTSEGFHAMNPLLTFKTLPNMPLFHVSAQLEIHGPYFVTCSGPGQWFQALSAACQDLRAGRVRFALVGAVADQRNALGEFHFSRMQGKDFSKAIDSACFWVLASDTRGRAAITSLRLDYQAVHPFAATQSVGESIGGSNPLGSRLLPFQAGPVEPALEISLRLENGRQARHELRFSDSQGFQTSIELDGSGGFQ